MPTHPACPRCGYDQSGIVASWDDSCPLDGICSECGLTFLWRDVLVPNRIVPRWSFEHARHWLGLAWIATFLQSLVPWRFWKRLKLEDPICTGRLMAYAVVAFVLTHVAVGISAALLTRALYHKPPLMPPDSAKGWHVLMNLIWPYGVFRPAFPARNMPAPFDVWCWVVVVWAAVVPVMFGVRGHTISRACVRRAHLLRGWAYSLSWLPLLLGGWVSLKWIACRSRNMAIWMRQHEWSLFLVTGFVLCWVWGWMAVRYMRVNRPTLTVVVIVWVSGLVATAVVCVWPWNHLYSDILYLYR